ncbi:lipid II flippase MurJ [Granulicella cerasi]|uniref:Lipid II flippase MurJ n=1 Tax=Granulicella cerasi TaxID=741063 RepID=A0ABW1ZBV6_9BACT
MPETPQQPSLFSEPEPRPLPEPQLATQPDLLDPALAPQDKPAPEAVLEATPPAKTPTVASAALLLMVTGMLASVLGLLRTKYINHIFGAGAATDAYNAAFQLPDMVNYFLVGAASATLVTMLTRFREKNDEQAEQETVSAVLNAMLVVLAGAILIAELLTPLYVHHAFPRFDKERADLCISLTRLLLPAQLFFSPAVSSTHVCSRAKSSFAKHCRRSFTRWEFSQARIFFLAYRCVLTARGRAHGRVGRPRFAEHVHGLPHRAAL